MNNLIIRMNISGPVTQKIITEPDFSHLTSQQIVERLQSGEYSTCLGDTYPTIIDQKDQVIARVSSTDFQEVQSTEFRRG